MKKEIWGVNVIGNQGVNAENDFAIGANEAGDDVIIKIKDAEISGEEFATLKEIAEGGPTPGGGGFPEQDLDDPTFVPEANHYYKQKAGEKPAPVMTALYVGQEFRDGDKLHFDTTKTQELQNFLANLTHDDPAYLSDGMYGLAFEGILMVLEGSSYGTTGNVLMIPDANDPAIGVKPVYATEAGSLIDGGLNISWLQGWQNIDDNGDAVINISEDMIEGGVIAIRKINDGEVWNGVIAGTLEEAPASKFIDGVIYFYDGEEYHAITGEGGEGGGMPDPADAEDGDVIKVTVTPAEYEADPKIAVGDVITDLWALNSVVPDLSQLTYDDHRFEQSMGVVVADLMRGTYIVPEGDEDEGATLTFSLIAFNMDGVSGILMTAGQTSEQERPNDVIVYITGEQAEGGYGLGWITGAPLQDGYANLMVMPFDDHIHFPELTITELIDQDVWCKWIGKQKPFKKIKDEIKEPSWGKPYPEIKNDGQVLTTSAETYLLHAGDDILLENTTYDRFYFNTELSDDEVDSILQTVANDRRNGFEWTVADTLEMGVIYTDDYSVRALACSVENENFYIIYATASGTYTFTNVGELTVTKGWNQDGIDHCVWPVDDKLTIDPPRYGFNAVISSWGRLFTIQEGLYYGDVKNAKVEWKDPTTRVDQLAVDPGKMGHWSGDNSQQPVVVVYDNQGQDDKLRYMTMYDLKKEIVQLYKHRIKFAFTDNNNNAFNVRLTLINDVSDPVTIDTFDGYIASGVVSVNGVIYLETAKEYETIVDMYRTGGGGFDVTAASINSKTLKFYDLSFGGVTVNDLNDGVTALYPNLGLLN